MVHIDPLSILGDISVGVSFVLPFVTVMLLSRRIERLSVVRTYWLLFLASIISIAVYLLIHWSERLGIFLVSPLLLYYYTTAPLLISALSIALFMAGIVRTVSYNPTSIFFAFTTAGLLIPFLTSSFLMETVILVPHPLFALTLLQGFLAWCYISLAMLLLRKLRLALGRPYIPWTSVAGIIYLGVSGAFLLSVSCMMIGLVTPIFVGAVRGIVTAAGMVGGLLATISSLKLHIETAPLRPPPLEVKRVDTMVPQVDDPLGGGLPYPSCVVVSGPTGSGKTSLFLRIMGHRLREGDGVLFVCIDSPPGDIRDLLRIGGLDPKEFEEKAALIFVDCYTARSGLQSQERYSTSTILSDISITISKALSDLKGMNKIVLFDSITVVLQEKGLGEGMFFLRTLVAKMRVAKASLLVSFNSQALPKAASALVQETSDGTIELKIQESRGRLIRYLRIPRMAKLKPLTEWHEISLTSTVSMTRQSRASDNRSRNI